MIVYDDRQIFVDSVINNTGHSYQLLRQFPMCHFNVKKYLDGIKKLRRH